MTPPQPVTLVFYHPYVGWKYGDEILSERRAEALCKKLGIPYRRPRESDPDNWCLVLETAVAGTYFVKDFAKVVDEISKGDELVMLREHNPHDPLAVALCDHRSRKVGYVPRKDNQVIARLMDAGEEFRCIVVQAPNVDYVPISISIKRGKKVRRHFSHSFDCCSGDSVWIDAEPVRRGSWFHPISDNVRNLEFRYPLTRDNLWDLSWGHKSCSMDDRWNFFMEGRTMYISRSWTGNCIFEMELGDGGVHKLLVENDPDICHLTDRDALETLRDLMTHWTGMLTLNDQAVPGDVFGNVRIQEGEGGFIVDTEDYGVVRIHDGPIRYLKNDE